MTGGRGRELAGTVARIFAPAAAMGRVGQLPEVVAGLVAGAAGALAYLGEMEADRAFSGESPDDLRLLGLLVGCRPNRTDAVGAVIHVANGMALGVLYAKVARQRLPGPGWLRGVLYANTENVALYPLLLIAPPWDGALADQLRVYRTWSAFAWSVPRHIAYGAVLGALVERLVPAD